MSAGLKRVHPVLAITAYMVFLCIAPAARAGDFTAQATLGVVEEYDDNVFLTEKNRTTDYITDVNPSVALDYKSPLWNWDLGYSPYYLHFASGSVGDSISQNINMDSSAALVQNFFYIDSKDVYQKASLSLSRDYTQLSLFVNQTDRNAFTLTPHFKFIPGGGVTLDTGYTYQNIWYKTQGINKTDDIFFANAAKGISPALEFTAGAQYTIDCNDIDDYNKTDLLAGSTYKFTPESAMSVQAGESLVSFSGNGTRNEFTWQADLTRQFARFTAELKAGSQIFEDPSNLINRINTYSAGLRSNSQRTPLSLSVSLSEYTDLFTDQLQYRRYGVYGAGSHNLTNTVRGSVNFSVERYDDVLQESYTNRFFSGIGLTYPLSQKLALTFAYSFVYSRSPMVVSDCYLDDRIIVGINFTPDAFKKPGT